MRSKKPFLIASFLGVWIFVTYVLWSRQSTDDEDRIAYKDAMRSLSQLEGAIKEETQINHDLIKRLLVSVKEIEKLKEEAAAAAASPNLVAASSSTQSRRNTATTAKSNAVGNAQLTNNEKSPDPVVVKEIVLEATPYVQANLSALRVNASRDHSFRGPVIPILVFACNRVSVRQCLDNLVQYRPNIHQFPIIVSQDCNDEATRNVIQSYKDVTLISHPDQSEIIVPPKHKKFKGYYNIARHYGWALNTTFKEGFDYVIIVEDDLNVSPDFYEYFLATHELLRNDSSLWCVSAWNDNGKTEHIDEGQPELLYRTDFFPGLGWMLTKELWAELSVKWPRSFWDDWIREPQQRKNRACIRPEISRTRTFGKIGVSNGLFYEKYLRNIKLSEEFVGFTKMDLSPLLQSNYDATYIKQVYDAPVVTFEELRRGLVQTKDAVRIQYNTKDQYKRTAKLLGLMFDFKSGVPRTGYHGIVSFSYHGQRVYLAPNVNWKGYDLSWS